MFLTFHYNYNKIFDIYRWQLDGFSTLVRLLCLITSLVCNVIQKYDASRAFFKSTSCVVIYVNVTTNTYQLKNFMSFYFHSLAQYKHYLKQIIKTIVINFFWIFFSHQNRKISKWYFKFKRV